MKILIELNVKELTEEIADRLTELVYENCDIIESWEEVIENENLIED